MHYALELNIHKNNHCTKCYIFYYCLLDILNAEVRLENITKKASKSQKINKYTLKLTM